MHPAFWIGGNINTRALCLYLLIAAAWRRAVLCALAAAVEKGLQIDYDMMNRNWQVVKPSGATSSKMLAQYYCASNMTRGDNAATSRTSKPNVRRAQ